MVFKTTTDGQEFLVIHPLDDIPEEKLTTGESGPTRMTPTVRTSLWVLRAYLIGMMLLVLHHVLDLARVTGP